MIHASSRRIIVIDDQPEIHEDFRKILSPASQRGGNSLARLRAAVKGQTAPAENKSIGAFELVSATQGEDGYKRILEARTSGQPFSIAYVDMRMPPGWDGLRTLKEIWNADPEIQFVVCTAYSDHPWSEIDDLAGASDRLLVLKKPFDPVEIRRMTATLSAKWRLTREALQMRDRAMTPGHTDPSPVPGDILTHLDQVHAEVRHLADQAQSAAAPRPLPPSEEPQRYSLQLPQDFTLP